LNRTRSSLILAISRKRSDEWGLKDGAAVPLHCGLLQGTAVVRQVEDEQDMTSVRWQGGRLRWHPYELPGRVTRDKSGVRIGPVIGIMTTGMRRDDRRPVGGRSDMLGDFVRAAKELNVLCYLFNAGDVDWTTRSVRGATLIGGKAGERWRFYEFPLPDVVYNRVPHRSAEIDANVLRCKRRFDQYGVKVFNERFINKKEMYQWLLRDEETRDLIPKTDRMSSPDSLSSFCRRHGLVYLKPTGGSLGIGILRVEHRGGEYAVRYRRGKEHSTAVCSSPAALHAFVRQQNRSRTYLMQQGIRLMTFKGQVTDFRVHLHKNGTGVWQAAGIGAKVAGRGAVTTHVHSGGHVRSGDEVLRTWYGEQAETMRDKLVEASVRVASSLEGMLKGPVGEWGLDAGIDVAGRVWIFESNAKPGRAIFKHPDLREAGRSSARMVIEYGALLAGTPLRKGGGP